jgi:uncharacterized protein YeaO (DUF488 family)
VSQPGFEIQRAYDRTSGQGLRVLVDRLWPRGITKAELSLDLWAKVLAPTTELRRWYGHEPARFPEFADRYRIELASAPALAEIHHLRSLAVNDHVVLVTATKDVARSGAQVLLEVLEAPR